MVVIAAAGDQAHAAGGISVVGGAHIWDEPGVGSLSGVAAFETAGQSYLLAPRHDNIHIINVTDPFHPARVGGIDDDRLAELWFVNLAIFYPPDGRVYAAVVGDGSWILDVTDPTNPEIVAGAPTGTAFGDANQMAVSEWPDGSIHALMAAGADLWTVDITDPRNPVVSDRLDLIPGVSRIGNDMAFLERDGRNYLVYANLWVGVLIADLTDPASPVLVSSIRHHDDIRSSDDFPTHDISELASDVVISDGYAKGLRHADTVTVFDSPEGRTYAMAANSGITVGSGESEHRIPAGIAFLDVTDPHVPVPMGYILHGEGGFGTDIRDIAILDSPYGRVHAAVSGGQDVSILDVTDPANPAQAGRIRDGEGGFDYVGAVHGMAVVPTSDGRSYLAMAGREGIQMADVTDPGEPTAAGGIRGSSGSFGNPAVFEQDGRVYAAGVVGVDTVSMVDITDPLLPDPPVSVRDGEDGFDVLDEVRDVEMLQTSDGRVYAMAVGREGLQVIDVTDPAYPAAAGAMRNGTDGFDLGWIIHMGVLQTQEGRGYLLVADHGRGIHVVDVTDPHSPVLAGSLLAGEGDIDLLGGVHDVDVFASGGRPYVLMTGDWGIHTIDMADPVRPVVAGTIDGTVNGTFGGHGLTAAYQSVVFESAEDRVHALVADYMTGIHIVDLTDPDIPVHTKSVPVRVEDGIDIIPGSDVSAFSSPDGRVWALVAGLDAIQVLDITDPSLPSLVDVVPAKEGGLGLESTPWDIIALEPAGGRVHILAGDGDRLWVLDATYPLPPAVPGLGGWTWDVYTTGPRPGVAIPGSTDDVAVVESPDNRTYMMWVGPAGGLLAEDVTGSHEADDPDFWQPDPEQTTRPTVVLDGPEASSTIELFRPHDGRTYMMIGGGDAILVVDVTYPSEPVPVADIRDNRNGFYSLGGIRDMAAFASPDGRVLALVGSDDGIQVVDVTNPYAPYPAGSISGVPGIPAPGGIHWIAAVLVPDGRVFALAADGVGRAGILDITDPRLPVQAGIMPLVEGTGSIREMAVFETGGHVHVMLVGEGGSHIVDITHPTDPVLIAVFG